jgi:hypothetical protein
MKKVKLKLLSSLVKVFPDQDPKGSEFKQATSLKGEVFSFQVAYCLEERLDRFSIKINSPLEKKCEIFEVALNPSEYLGVIFDKDVLKSSPGLFPDCLLPIHEDGIKATLLQWRSIWVRVNLDKNTKPGKFPITLQFHSKMGNYVQSKTFYLTVLKSRLPKQTLIHTEWFHGDGLATWYHCEPWSKAYWKLLENYFRNMAEHGQNTVLTPLFTPPLDTEVGGERPTIQLLNISKVGTKYVFDFKKLGQWITLAKKCGLTHFEMAHLFTQWGAKNTPKIIVNSNHKEIKMFGWHVAADSTKYLDFLSQLLPALTKYLKQKKLTNYTFFHISDEPNLSHLESYKKAVTFVRPYLKDFKMIDALSDLVFYKEGLVQNPVPANNHIEPFMQANIKNLWTYYCVGQQKLVPNRFFHFPSYRNRVQGVLLYIYDLKGFLHWGYNFWFSQGAKSFIDPFKITDAGRAFPSGDAFLVYPGKNGPLDSIRHEVFRESLQDLRALQALEKKIGRENTLKVIHQKLNYQLTMTKYPRKDQWLLNLRSRVNHLLS